MPKKKLGKHIIIANIIIFIVIMSVGGVSIFLSWNIQHNGYKIKEISEHIVIVDEIHINAYRLVLFMHHALIDPSPIYSREIIALISSIEAMTKKYKAEEESELYSASEATTQVGLVDLILKDIDGLKELPSVFGEFTKTGKLDKDKVIGLEEYAYHIESISKDINKIHFVKIAKFQDDSIRYMWIVLGLYTGFSVIGGFSIYLGHRIISRNIINPIKELSSATLEFSEGDFSKRVHTGSRTEIGMLYKSFNEMAEKLQEHSDFLKKFNEELERKVKERTFELQEANEQLQRTQDALITAEKIAAIGEIATGVAHEIRNPLNSLSVNIQGLLRDIKGTCGEDKCRFYEITNLIQYELKRANDILDNFVSFAKFPEPKFMDNDINQIIREVAAIISPEAEKSKAAIDLSLSDSIPVFKFDRPQIKEVLMNLFQNALHAMPEGGILKIATSIRGHSAVIDVSDTGMGIPEKNLNKVFMPFFSTRDKGLGLGLAIVKRIVEGHRGRITCSSKTGEGTLFEITLPTGNG
ncbi:MAG: HAMP domain-containing protein [Nitrospirae bacterium]|nr:HAMP domain-containing protein [Nitrospirota bacterium]